MSRVSFFGGVERIIMVAAAAARRRGQNVVLACPEPGEFAIHAKREGLRVLPAAIARGRAPQSILQALSVFRQFVSGRKAVLEAAINSRATILHTHHPITAFQAYSAAQRLHLPLILHVHETLPVPALYAVLMRWARRRCDMFVCVSRASLDMTRSFVGDERRVRLVYNGVNRQFLDKADGAPEVIGQGPHIGVFGVLEPRKGQDDFLAACTLLADEYPGAEFWIVGAVSFEDKQGYADELQRLAAARPLAGRVHFTGHRSDIGSLMTAMNLVVLPSRNFESLPTVLVEACTLGRTVVATDVGGVREIIEDGVTGIVVPPGDIGALADGMRRALGPEHDQLGTAARHDARMRFCPDRFERELMACYDALANSAVPSNLELSQ